MESQPVLQLFVPHLWVRASSQAASVLSDSGDPTHSLLLDSSSGEGRAGKTPGCPNASLSNRKPETVLVWTLSPQPQ